MSLITVNDAINILIPLMHTLSRETVSITESVGRVLAEEVQSRVTAPIEDIAALDGFAVLLSDIVQLPVTMEIAGSSTAARPYRLPLEHGQAVRVFSGAPVPENTEAIIPLAEIEKCNETDTVTITTPAVEGAHICFAGLDFSKGEASLKPGRIMNPRAICAAAAMNIPWLVVYHHPRIALFTCGDELAMPGEISSEDTTYASTNVALAAYIKQWGGHAINLGLCKDELTSISRMADAATGIDLLLTTGALSDSAQDVMQKGLQRAGYEVERYMVNISHPTPVLIGHRDDNPVLSLPGDPISCLLAINLLLRPVIRRLHGMDPHPPMTHTAQLDRDLDVNDLQQNYLRATLSANMEGRRVVNPVSSQDNMLLSAFAASDCLMIVNPQATKKGDTVEIIPLNVTLGAY